MNTYLQNCQYSTLFVKRTQARAASMLIATIALLLAAAGCDRDRDIEAVLQLDDNAASDQATGEPWFENTANERGLDFIWHSGAAGNYYLPEIVGGGAALFDMDDDGDLDLYLVQGGSLDGSQPSRENRLLRNTGDGSFEDITSGSGAGDRGYGMGIACGDYDNDGDLDLYITNVGANVLLRNDGNGQFTDVTEMAGVGDDGVGASAAFFDFDRDGHLDLFVTNYVNWSVSTETDCYNEHGALDYCSPNSYQARSSDVLYRNRGDGTFEDVSIPSGVASGHGNGLGVAAADFNDDGRLDIFVANDGNPDALWVNQGDGTFANQAMILGCALDSDGQAKAGMGVAVNDIDDDGDPDLLVCNLRDESDSLFLNESGQYFRDATASAGLELASRRLSRFGMAWADFDNDGLLDIYQASGKVMTLGASELDDPYAEPNLLMQGMPGIRWEPLSPAGGTREPLVHTSRAAAFGDIDNDGGVDIVVINKDAPAYLLSNVVSDGGNWIMLDVRNEHGSPALNATVTLRAEDRVITREVRAGYSYFASNDPRIHIGLGELDAVDDVSVRWLDGTQRSFGRLGANEVHRLEKRAGQ